MNDLHGNKLLNIGNGKMAISESNQCINLPMNILCKIRAATDEFSNIVQNHKIYQWILTRIRIPQLYKYNHTNLKYTEDTVYNIIQGSK